MLESDVFYGGAIYRTPEFKNLISNLPGSQNLYQTSGFSGFQSHIYRLDLAKFKNLRRIKIHYSAYTFSNSAPDPRSPVYPDAIFSGIDGTTVYKPGAAYNTVILTSNDSAKPLRGFSIETLNLASTYFTPTILISQIEFYGEISEEPALTVKLANIQVTQTVPNFKFENSPADLDLVAGKSTAIQYDLAATGAQNQSNSVIKILVSDSSGKQIASHQVSAAELLASRSESGVAKSKTFIDLPYVPNEGVNEIFFSVQNGDALEKVSRKVRVKKTHPLAVSYIAVSGKFDCPTFGSSTCFGPLFEETVREFSEKSTEFMQAVFPISDGGVSAVLPDAVYAARSWVKLPSNPALSVIGARLAIIDMLEMRFLQEVNATNADRFIGVVPRDYFDYRGLDNVTGITSVSWIKSALVEEKYWTTTAHEIAHTMGIDHVSQPMTIDGFWVSSGARVKNAVNIMLAEAGAKKASLENQWVDSNLFNLVFKNRLVDPVDPALLIVAGFIDRSGKVELLPVSYLPEGFQSESSPGDDSAVRLRNSAGVEIVAGTFTTSFKVLVTSENPIGTVPESDIAPFLVKLPYRSDASTLEIVSKGSVLSTVYPNSLLIRDTIQRISDSSFRKNEKLERRLLLKFSHEIDKFGQYCNKSKKTFSSVRIEEEWQEQCSKVQVHLALALRERIDRILLDSPVRSGPLAMIKPEVLRTIDSAILRIVPEQVAFGARREYEFRILPYRIARRDEDLFQIVSVTQGAHGSVRIERNGLVSYRPSSKVFEDQFTVTLRDSWGASAEKTIRIYPNRR